LLPVSDMAAILEDRGLFKAPMSGGWTRAKSLR
jgi:hypothetical protein